MGVGWRRPAILDTWAFELNFRPAGLKTANQFHLDLTGTFIRVSEVCVTASVFALSHPCDHRITTDSIQDCDSKARKSTAFYVEAPQPPFNAIVIQLKPVVLLVKREKERRWLVKVKMPCHSFVSAALMIVICGCPLHAWAAPAATTTTLAVTSGGSAIFSGGSVASGSEITLTAAVNAGSAKLTIGQIGFCDASATSCTGLHLLGTAQLTNAGTAVLRLHPGIGSHNYQAIFAGTPHGTTPTAASTSSPVTLTVTGTFPTTTTIKASGNAGNYSLTAAVTGYINAQALQAPPGSVSFVDTTNNLSLGTATLGTGTQALGFLNSSSPATVMEPNVVATADFNGDGIPDLAVSNSNSGQVLLTILLGNGDGTFTAAASPTVGLYPDSIVVADFNGDGIPDLALTSVDQNIVTILLGVGDGTFTSAPNLNTVSTPQSVAMGDFNGDGIADLAVVNAGSILIFLGNGDGTFTAVSTSLPTGMSPIAVAVGNFNEDGIADLAVVNNCGNSYPCNNSNGTIMIFLGKGDGTFTQVATTPTVGPSPTGLVVADFNGDGILDLAVADYDGENSGNAVTILLGMGDGTFKAPAYYSAPGLNFRSLSVGDFNGDGISDLAVVGFWHGTLVYLQGKGDGTFAAAIPIAANIPLGSGYMASADFNGDGLLDLAIPNQDVNGTVVVLLTQLTETWTAAANQISPLGTGTHQVDASYPGDSSFSASSSATIGLTAMQATPLVTITSASSNSTTAQALTITIAVTATSANPLPTGTVTLTSGSYTSAATTLTNGSATIGIPAGSLAIGTETLTASYSGDAKYRAATGTAPVTVASPSFSITGAAVSVAPGASTGNISTITVAPSGGFTGAVALTAAITTSPTGSVNPPTFSFGATSPVSITGASAGTATLAITTLAAAGCAQARQSSPEFPWYRAGGAVLACAFLCFLPAQQRRWRAMLGMVLLLVVLSTGVEACGGNKGSATCLAIRPATTAGNYTVTVTGVSGAITEQGTVTLTVQ